MIMNFRVPMIQRHLPDVDNGSEQVSQNKRWFNPDEDEDESSDTSYSEDENEYGDDEFL